MGGIADIGDFIGALIGDALAKGDYDTAERLQMQASKMYDGIDPNLKADSLGPSASAGMKADPRMRAARMAALDKLMAVGMEGGMDLESRAAMEEAKQQAGQYEQSQRGAMMADAQRRGMGGSNLSMASQMGAQQAGAQRVGMQGMQAAADARKRALSALAQSGDLAGGIERDDFGQRLGLADRSDAISRFNVQNANNFKMGNFDRDMDRRDAQYGAKQDEAGIYSHRGDRTVDRARGAGRAVGSVGDVALKAKTMGLWDADDSGDGKKKKGLY